MGLALSKLEKYAEVLLWGLATARAGTGGKMKPYDVVLLKYDPAALPLARALHRKLVERRMQVVLRPNSGPGIEKDFFTLADEKQLAFVDAGMKPLAGSLNGYIVVRGPESLTHLQDVDPRKFGTAAIARKSWREIMDRREETGEFGWTLCSYPTAELARQAGLTLPQYTAQIEKACFLNEPDPVGKWKEIFRHATEIKKWLNALPAETLRLESKSADLTVTLGAARRFLGLSGHNIPSFELFTSPDWRGTKGVYFADMPTFYNGNYVKGIRLEFKNGRAVKINAEQGEAFVRKMLAMDRGACQVGEFSLTDRRFSKIGKFMADILFDENYGGKYGNSHIAVGSAYSDAYAGDRAGLTRQLKEKLGFNNSSLHWDIINSEKKRVTAALTSGKTVTVYENGEFKY
ncbi:MAG: aminopeptidase [Elusimicrobiaceae bacterium]|nr:aminopeptidase [Elusimicrobiaceae bacterium]